MTPQQDWQGTTRIVYDYYHSHDYSASLAGDTWPPNLAVTDENGRIDPLNTLFVLSFRLVVDWILLQASNVKIG